MRPNVWPALRVPAAEKMNVGMAKLAALKQFALLIAVNPFVTGCVKGGGKSKALNLLNKDLKRLNARDKKTNPTCEPQ